MTSMTSTRKVNQRKRRPHSRRTEHDSGYSLPPTLKAAPLLPTNGDCRQMLLGGARRGLDDIDSHTRFAPSLKANFTAPHGLQQHSLAWDNYSQNGAGADGPINIVRGPHPVPTDPVQRVLTQESPHGVRVRTILVAYHRHVFGLHASAHVTPPKWSQMLRVSRPRAIIPTTPAYGKMLAPTSHAGPV